MRTRTEPSAPEDVPRDGESAGIRTSTSKFGPAASTLVAKDTSAGQQSIAKISNKRRSIGQGSEQVVNHVDIQAGENDEDESPENLQRLTEKLESLKKQKEEVDRQIAEQEVEAKIHHSELAQERDGFKQVLKDRDDALTELKKYGNQVDKANRNAQNRKASKEKLLQRKKAERQKIQEDTERWKLEIEEMKQDTAQMSKELEDINAVKDEELAKVREGVAQDQKAIKTLEEEIRLKGADIKSLEHRREQMNNDGMDERERARKERLKDEAWEVRHQAMQVQVGTMWQTLQQAKLEEQRAEEHLNWWLAKRAQHPEQFAPLVPLETPASMQRQRSKRSRQNISRASTHSSSGYQGGPSPFASTSVNPQPYASSSYFNTSNGTAVSSAAEQSGLSTTEAATLIGGAFMSPGARELLPSNLFHDENTASPGRESFGATNGDPFLSHTLPNSDASVAPPRTPGSAESRGGSLLPSPHESMNNLHGFQTRGDAFGDDLSIHSTQAPPLPSLPSDSNPLATSRLANLFTFNRQRGKANAQEAPLLGTLKQGQSQSFPRNMEQDGLEFVASRRRRGSYGHWAKPVTGLLARNTVTPEDNGLIRARTGSGRASRLNMFKARMDTLEPTPYPDQPSRPSSTYSFDQTYGRPSTESQHMWNMYGDSMPNRSSPLGASWATSQGPWSRVPSRRASIQHGSATNLSIGSTPLDPDDVSGSISKQRSEQAPIGTRPRSAQRPITPKLNPAAPSFKTLFNTRRSGKPDKGKAVEKPKDKDAEDEYEIEDGSPQNPRLSRDAQSITTATSTADSGDSFDRTTSGTPLEAVASSAPKESLMQKISRKSSSSKFNVSYRGIFSKRAGEPSTPGEFEEDNASDGQLGGSAASTPQHEKSRAGISWTNIRRKSKKGELIERESEAGEDED